MFGNQADLIEDSTSDVGGKYGHFAELVALAIAYSVFCAWGGLYALKVCGYKDKIAPILYCIGIVLFLVTCLIPYDKNCEGTLAANGNIEYAIKLGDVHNVLARVSIGVLVIVLLYFHIVLFFKNKAVASVCLTLFLAVVCISIWLLVDYGTCSVMECIMQGYLALLIFALPLTFTLLDKRKNKA